MKEEEEEGGRLYFYTMQLFNGLLTSMGSPNLRAHPSCEDLLEGQTGWANLPRTCSFCTQDLI